MSARAGLSAFGLGAVPCVVLSCALMILGWTDIEPVPVADGPPTRHNLDQRAAMVQKQLPDSFTVRVVEPFVLFAETTPANADRLEQTMKRTVDRLEDELSVKHPDELIDVWLFADTASYRAGVRKRLADWPRTLHGFYSPKQRRVVINLESGVGTLEHELAHPFLRATFPNLPAWIDEGVASSFDRAEANAEQRDHQLVRLQRALRRGRLPSIAALSVASNVDFYSDPRHLSYPQARTVMMWLRERGLLRTFLQEVVAHPDDPTGFDALVRVSGDADAETLEQRWQSYVLRLDSMRSVATNSKH